jgi:hypothetical protein
MQNVPEPAPGGKKPVLRRVELLPENANSFVRSGVLRRCIFIKTGKVFINLNI